MSLFRNFSSVPIIFRHLSNLQLRETIKLNPQNCISRISLTKRTICTSKTLNDLMEFFDHKDNWGQQEVKSGRAWKLEELRIKSNSDLHKLWFVLLKERNMLLTMEEECKREYMVFPSPERIDKVEESMENLEAVVRERNRAYYELETGETGEQPDVVVEEPFNLPYQPTEHAIPKHLNKKWQEEHTVRISEKDQTMYRALFREQRNNESRKARARDFNHVIGLMNRYPNLDMEAVKEQYPDVDIERAKASRRYKPRYIPED